MKIFNFITKQCLTLLCTAFITTQANASVCFLPDADNCGTNDIVTQCDGIRFFAPIKGQSCAERVNKYHNMKGEDGQDRLSYMSCSSAGDCDELKCAWSESTCKANADSRSSKNGHYECYLDSDNNCWYQTYTPCNEYDEPASNPSYPLDSPEDGKACKANTWSLTHHLCSDKGIASTQKGTRTTYDCVTIVPKVSGCDGYNLSSPISGYDCDPCEPDVYKNDYDGNYNYSGKGNTVYSCSKSEGCSGYSLTASEASSKEASGDYRCHDCTPKNTDSNGVTTDGTTVYKCGKITTSTTTCPSNYISAAEADELKKDKCYSCTGCTPTTDYYEDGVWYNGTSGTTVFTCSKPDCTGKSKASDCGTGKEFVAASDCAKFSNGEACGDCIDCNDETNPINKCFGKYTCKEEGRHGVGAVTCTCGNVPYYDRCEVEETCTTAASKVDCSDGACKLCSADTDLGYWLKHGYYEVGEKCKKIDLTPVYYYASCTGRDCNGNYGKAYGMKTCKNDEGADGAKSAECGGYKYFSECKETCTTAGSKIDCSDGACKLCSADTDLGYWLKHGYYEVGEKCEQNDGTKVYYYASCTGRDCNGNYGKAYGMKICKNNEGADGAKSAECGGYKYFSACKETCTTADSKIDCSDGACKLCSADTDLSYWLKHGYYEVGEKCEQNDGTKVYYYASCTGRDCNGNYGKAYGLKTCASDQYPGGKTVECGGYTYSEYCMGECNYEDDAQSCADKGKDFNALCHDKNDKEWGECKDKE